MQESVLVFSVFPSLAQWPPDSKHLGFVNMQIPGLQGQVLHLWGRAEEICQDSASSRKAGTIYLPLLLYPHCLAQCLAWGWHSTCLLEMSEHLQCFLCIGYCSKAFSLWTHLIHITALWGGHCCYPHGTGEEAEAQREEMTCPESQLVGGGAGVWTNAC